MQIERRTLDASARAPHKPGACIGCPDCKGPCFSLAEFLRLPEVILHMPHSTRRSAPA